MRRDCVVFPAKCIPRLALLLGIMWAVIGGSANAERADMTIRPASVTLRSAPERQVLWLSAPLLADGAVWDHRESVTLGSDDSILVSLAEPSKIAGIVIQADNNDAYFVEGSPDGVIWSLLWVAPPVSHPAGLVARGARIAAERAGPYRAVRVRPGIGDSRFSVARLQIFSDISPGWEPPAIEDPFLLTSRSDTTLGHIKRVTAIVGLLIVTALLGIRRCRARTGEGDAQRECGIAERRLRVVIIAAGFFAAALWTNLFRFHGENTVHYWDFMHYYLGARYFPEIDYTGLYDCVAVADKEDGFDARLERERLRDLRTNKLVPAADAVRDPTRCTGRFAADRWEAFKADVRWFRDRTAEGRWAEWKRDHGFNGTPLWISVARLLSEGDTATPAKISRLALVDGLLLLFMWIVVIWAFGAEAAAIAMLVWGTNHLSGYYWTGGSFLRQLSLVTLVTGVACLKRGYPALAGSGFAVSTLLRIFPGFVLLGPFLAIGWGFYERRSLRLEKTERRFLLGLVLTLICSLPLSLLASGRWDAYSAFLENSRKHLETPLTNHMGFRTVLSFRPELRAKVVKDPRAVDPFAQWKQYRQLTFGSRTPWFYAGLTLYVIILAFAVRGTPLWLAAVLGAGAIPFFSELTCYFYSFLLLWALPWAILPSMALTAVAYSWLSWEIAEWVIWSDDRFTALSVVVLVMIAFVTGREAYRSIRRV